MWGTLGYAWPQQLQPLATALGAKLRADMLRLVRQAYANLSPAKLAALLGVPEAEATRSESLGSVTAGPGCAPYFVSEGALAAFGVLIVGRLAWGSVQRLA